jgi:hypothetical protein
MRKVEFLVAFDNRTWDTTIEDVPCDVPDENLRQWAELTLLSQARYRKAVLITVYCLNPLDEDDDDDFEDDDDEL